VAPAAPVVSVVVVMVDCALAIVATSDAAAASMNSFFI
jgi:hypothetical protein